MSGLTVLWAKATHEFVYFMFVLVTALLAWAVLFGTAWGLWDRWRSNDRQ